MKNLRQLGFILSAGTIAAFSLTGCGDETTPPPGTAGTSSGGTAAGGSGTSGSGTGGTSASGSSSGGGGTGGSGTAGKGGGGAGGTGGASGGTGGATGGGGAGGTGGATGGGGAGGASASCMTYCGSSDNGVRQVCAGKFAPAAAGKLDTEAHCLESCAKPASAMAMGVACWNMHTTLAKAEPADSAGRTMHCGHATGSSLCDPLP